MRLLYLLFLCGTLSSGLAQSVDQAGWKWLEPADTFNRKRFWAVTGVGAAIYAGASYGLYQTWYRDFPQGSFRTIDDFGEWLQMDKAGHLVTTYTEARLLDAGARWTGMSPNAARWTAFGVSNALQLTVEVMDGFSEQWGFSWSDFGANVLGASVFLVQDMVWNEQRILIKASSDPRPHPTILTPNVRGEGYGNWAVRGAELYGSGYLERYVKDYNTLTVWLSVNPRSFVPGSRLPDWLNIAVGYGAENLYGAYGNGWTVSPEEAYRLPKDEYPRYRQYLLSPDIDLTRIRTNKRWLKLLFGITNFIKVPAPALELRSTGETKFHLLFW